ncbi:hypothetical protein TNCV_3925761 [Trichonephila clavipes]|nr:hypothetical protein TNCV_3925761 [Trichonephila clavipes]
MGFLKKNDEVGSIGLEVASSLRKPKVAGSTPAGVDKFSGCAKVWRRGQKKGQREDSRHPACDQYWIFIRRLQCNDLAFVLERTDRGRFERRRGVRMNGEKPDDRAGPIEWAGASQK